MAKGKSRGRNPYRRRRRAEPGEAEGEPERDDLDFEADPSEEPDPGRTAQLIVDARRGAVDREAAGAIARPLGELARAFAVQAEILKEVHDNQTRLQERLDADERSELVLSSTRALNDTFRGVRTTQKELLDALRGERRVKGGWRWAVLVLVLAGFGAGAWLVVESRRDATRRDSSLEEGVQAVRADLDRLKTETIAGTREEKQALRADLEAARREEAEARVLLDRSQEEINRIAGDAESARAEMEALREQLRRARARDEEREAELAKLRDRNAELDQQVTFYLEKAERAEARARKIDEEVLARLRQGGAAALAAAGDEPPPIVEGVAAAVEEASPSGEPEPAPAEADTGALVADLNALMSKHRSNSRFRFTSVGGVGEKALEDVVFTESVPGRGVVKEIRAKSVSLHLSARGDMVELHFLGGTKRSWRRSTATLGDAVPFYNDSYRDSILCLNGDEWRARRWAFLTVD